MIQVIYQRLPLFTRIACALLAISLYFADRLSAQEAEWIWTPEHSKENVPEDAECYFRKTFALRDPEAGVITIAADDGYELYVNGTRIGVGTGYRNLVEYDISASLVRGVNVVAVEVINSSGDTAALCARVSVKERGGAWTAHGTNKTWRINPNSLPLWNSTKYDDRGWAFAQSFGRLGQTVPWDLADSAEETPKLENSNRFTIEKEFVVEQVLEGELTGSAIAMSFNEFGHLVISQEGGGIVVFIDTDEDGIPDSPRKYCEDVKNAQGILCLNGEVFVTAEGPEGPGLYRLADKDRDGKAEVIRRIVEFAEPMGEHGAHGIALGPDGLIYVVLGNHIHPAGEIDPASPYRNYYEGDLIQPRYEDPGGHAVGVKAPGGMVIRTDAEGSAVQIVAGGLRNAYDLAFNADGELFIPDSDMESDDGAPWYRPTRLYHILNGGEYGWRSGWANWPDYYIDQLPPVINFGRGSPTGIAVYDHHMFPQRYQGAIFAADWSEGRILAISLKPSGGSYTAEASVFLSGSPLNVTDLEVGPDGCLYFITGGRGTAGGLYRVKWKGEVPEGYRNLGTGISAVIRQPQISSAPARQKIALLKKELGANWGTQLIGVAASVKNPPNYRIRALDLMQLYGPQPSEEFVIHLSKEGNERLRARAAKLLANYDSAAARKRLVAMLEDGDRLVRRRACEAIYDAGFAVDFAAIESTLALDDRFTAWSARRLLETLPVDSWRNEVLQSKNDRVLIQGGLALAIAHGDAENGAEILRTLAVAMNKFVTDRDFLDMLRVMQVAIQRGELRPEQLAALSNQLREEFPTGEPSINRELVRLLIYMQESSILDRYLEFLESDAPEAERAHLGLHLRYLNEGWTSESRLKLLTFYESAQKFKAGNAFTRYLINVTRDFAGKLTPEESRLVLMQGSKWPNAALGAIAKLPERLDPQLLESLIRLDAELDPLEESQQRLKIGIVALMARSGDDASVAYMRRVWKEDPERRQAAAMGLALHPQPESWDYLVRSLPILDANPSLLVLQTLRNMEEAPDEPEPYRAVILLGFKLKEKGADEALALLEYWNGESPQAADDSWQARLAAWQGWYAKQWPDALPADPPSASADAKWQYDQLHEFLIKKPDPSLGDAVRGAAVFAKAQCAKCHRMGNRGESVGPDLTAVSKRFMRKEILESIYYPSHVISDQYAAKTIVTVSGKTITGLMVPGGADELVLVIPSGEKVRVKKTEVEEIAPSKLSAMPAGLLDPLTQAEIIDLFAYLQKPTAQPVADRLPNRTLKPR